jgi:hypothetical protein
LRLERRHHPSAQAIRTSSLIFQFSQDPSRDAGKGGTPNDRLSATMALPESPEGSGKRRLNFFSGGDDDGDGDGGDDGDGARASLRLPASPDRLVRPADPGQQAARREAFGRGPDRLKAPARRMRVQGFSTLTRHPPM